MKTLEFEQMETVEGGLSLGCALGIASAGLAFAGLFVATGGAGALIAAVS